MNEAFRQFIESLNPSLERLIAMEPVTAATLPSRAPDSCIYLFSEGDRHLYTGRTRRFRQRMSQQASPWSQHNQAALAFKLACECCGRMPENYVKGKGRAALACEPDFIEAFQAAKARVRTMKLRFVEEREPTRQALLEIYVSVALGTPYNDFNTH
jgi:predicted GIY-YIG superfamily endonuclease